MTPSFSMMCWLATVLSVASTVYAVPQAADDLDPNNCQRFTPPNTPAPSLPCAQFRGYPKTISQAKVDFYHYTRGFDPSKPRTALAIRDIRSATELSMDAYSVFAQLPDVVIILSPTLPDGAEGYSLSEVAKHKCFIRIAEEAIKNKDGFGYKRTLAHEMAHCIIRNGRPAYEKTIQNNWWNEGGAEFFANEIYPNEDPTGRLVRYIPSRTLWGQAYYVPPNNVLRQAYSAGLFLEFLANNENWSHSRVYQFILAQMSTDSDAAERADLAGQSEVTHNFPLFAQAYKDERIQFSDGSFAAQDNESPFTITTEKYSVDIGPKVETPISGPPFTIYGADIHLKSKSTCTIQYESALSRGGTVVYRRKGEGKKAKWEKLTGSTTLEPSCDADGTYEFLFTSTTEDTEDLADLSVKCKKNCRCKSSKRQAGDDPESCPLPPGKGKGFVLYPYQDAQHNAYCPKGTHASTLAAWCCPDGSNLDEPHASQVSLCCPGHTDCYHDIVPDNLRCADSSWVLWSQDFRQVGCCKKGYYPNSLRYCVKDRSQLGPGFTTIPQGSAPTPAAV